MTAPKIYLARMQCEPDFVPQFTNWYADKHTVELLEAGFLSCQYYHCDVGYPNVCNVYEIPGAELFSTNIYQHARKIDDERPAVLAHITDRSNTVYEPMCALLPDQGGGVGHEVSPGDINAPAVAVVFFDLEGRHVDDLVATVSADRTIWPRTGGVRRVRLCRFTAKHPNNPRDPRTWAVIAECETDCASDAAKDIRDRLHGRFQGALANVGSLAGSLSFRRVSAL